MKKRILITCTDSMMKQFLEPHVINLVEHGYEVEIACSEVLNRMAEVRKDLGNYVKIHQLSMQRSPLSKDNLKGYKEVKRIIDNGHFDLVWTNEPVMGVVTRLAAKKARKAGTKVLYMVHGFHFYKGAPLPNWLLFYPIEKIMASKADCICTINREDFARLQKFVVKKKAYIHGVGINTDRLQPSGIETNLRKELGIPDNAFIVLSVGELNENKNQKVIIQALALLHDPDIYYVLCGKGDQLENLKTLAAQCGLDDHVHFLGYQKDLYGIYTQSNIFAMPSKREGLPVASLEAMFCGLPLITSNIRGLCDVNKQGENGLLFPPHDVKNFAEGIQTIKNDQNLMRRIKENSQAAVKPFCIESAKQEIFSLVHSLCYSD